MSDLRVLMITQKVNLDDDVLGFTHTWVNKLAERVAQLRVLALSVGRHELCDNVTLYSMGKERGAGRLWRFANFNRVVAPLILRRRVDVVFVHMCPLYAVLAAPWAKLAHKPMVLWYTHKSVTRTLKLAHNLVDRVVTASPGSFRLPSDKVGVLGHGVDTDVFRPPEGSRPERPFTVLSVGRISPVKDYETLIEAADTLINREDMGDLRFVVVGDAGTTEQAAYREYLLALVRKRGLEEHFDFVGAVPHAEVVRYYQAADVFVSASQTGSLDKAGLEAMATSLPVVLCSPIFNDQLGGYVSQVIFREGDSRDLARKLATVVHMDAERRRDFGERVRRIAEGHSVDRLMDRMVSEFGDLGTGGGG